MTTAFKKTYSTSFEDHYEISLSLGIVHYKETKEFVLVNFDDGSEFLMAEDYEEAEKICKFILSLIEQKEDNS